MRNSALRAGIIAVVAIAFAIIGSQLLKTSDVADVVDSSNASTGGPTQGATKLEQPVGSSSRAGLSNSVGFVVRNSDGEIIDSGTVPGD